MYFHHYKDEVHKVFITNMQRQYQGTCDVNDTDVEVRR